MLLDQAIEVSVNPRFVEWFMLVVCTILVLWALARSQPAAADEWWASATVGSFHFDRTKHYNEQNFGLGAERRLDGDWRGHGGFYRNSLDRTTVYALASYTPWRWGEWRVGGAAGLGTGYNSRPIGVLAGGFAVREWRTFGVNVIVHPAAVALQVKVKF